MKYRSLGKSGLLVSEIGFGCWGIGGAHGKSVAYGETNDSESLEALRKAYDLGVNLFDTSDYYGAGHSERLLGQAFRVDRKNVLIASKCGMIPGSTEQRFDSDHLVRSIEGTLARLETDYLDLYQLHSPLISDIEDNQELWRGLERLIESGKVRAIGVSARSPQDAVIISERFPIDCIQVNFNFADQRAVDCGLLSLCKERDIGVIGRTPLSFGFLTGSISAKESFESTDHRSRWTSAQKQAWVNAANHRKRFDQESVGTGAQFALRFCLSFREISCVIPGMLNAKEVEENTLSSELGPLKEEIIENMTADSSIRETFLGAQEAP